MALNGHPWIQTDIRGSGWTSAALDGHPWIRMDARSRPTFQKTKTWCLLSSRGKVLSRTSLLIPPMPEKQQGQEVETSFSGRCSLRINHVQAQLLGSGSNFTEPPSFCLVLFNQDKSTQGMVKKTQIREKRAERRCQVGTEEKSCRLTQDQEGLSISSPKKPCDRVVSWLSTFLLQFWVGTGATTVWPWASAAPKATSPVLLLLGRCLLSSPTIFWCAKTQQFSQGSFFGAGFAIVPGTSLISPQWTQARPWSRMGESCYLNHPINQNCGWKQPLVNGCLGRPSMKMKPMETMSGKAVTVPGASPGGIGDFRDAMSLANPTEGWTFFTAEDGWLLGYSRYCVVWHLPREQDQREEALSHLWPRWCFTLVRDVFTKKTKPLETMSGKATMVQEGSPGGIGDFRDANPTEG